MSQIYYYTLVDLFKREWISQSVAASKAEPEIQDSMRIPFWAKHFNDSMFMEDLSRLCQLRQYNIEINNDMFVSCSLLDKYRLMSVLKIHTDIITSIAESPYGN